jgi:hypothetical protein
MVTNTPVPPPDPSNAGKTTRVSIEGTLASISAISALIVAAASMFTAVQALDVSQAAARQKIFESQLGVCMQFSDLTTQAADEGWATSSGLFEGAVDEAGLAELEARLEAGTVLSNALYRQYLQMTMVLPDEISDVAYKATEKRTEIYNKQIDAINAAAVTPTILAELERLSNEEVELLNEAAAACRDYVSSEAGL